jgi:hypothetical protein
VVITAMDLDHGWQEPAHSCAVQESNPAITTVADAFDNADENEVTSSSRPQSDAQFNAMSLPKNPWRAV